ncbi:MAG: DUF1998 domain-containing protein [Planctomycetes bacterium]|nr:DUF1998 domain-containing protein [Planctomycetota bacterium]
MSGSKEARKVGELRRSQVVTTFGPGAMVDLPDVSVLVGGLNVWHGVDLRVPIVEDRLQAKVADVLKLSSVRLFAPPVEQDRPDAPFADLGVWQFPTWFLAQVDRTVERNGRKYRTRPLVPGRRLEKGKWRDEDRVNRSVVPVRFVQACPHGHISDIDWYAFVGAEFSDTLWLDEGGAGNDFAEIYVRSERTGKARQLADAEVKNGVVLGMCRGSLRWIGPEEREDCNQPNRLLTRSASNAYFPQTQSVISIPEAAAELREAVGKVYDDFLRGTTSAVEVAYERRTKDKVKAALEGRTDEDVWQEVDRRRNGRPVPLLPIKQVEVETLRNQPMDEGERVDEVEFFARTRDISGLAPPLAGLIDRIVLVHRLREVVAQVGFTRFDAYAPDVDGELDIQVRRAPLARDVTWVPAIENRGEGVFIGFNREAISAWESRLAVVERGRVLMSAHVEWARERGAKNAVFPGLAYYCLHSLAHMLITEVSLACGYSSSSIRERVYVGTGGFGILLYTGGSGSEGTLGGLVEVGRRIEEYVLRAVERARLCSNDPVCAQHQADSPYEARFLHGAACHGCLLIAETSCEHFNHCLDRALVVPTVDDGTCALLDGGGTAQ